MDFVSDITLPKGASPTYRSYGYTPAKLAVKHDHKAIYDLLIANGGRPVSGGVAAQIALVETGLLNWDVRFALSLSA